jgi:hypothetical protein
MRVFVAGATGVIGRQLVPRLVAAGDEVHDAAEATGRRSPTARRGVYNVVDDDPAPVPSGCRRWLSCWAPRSRCAFHGSSGGCSSGRSEP